MLEETIPCKTQETKLEVVQQVDQQGHQPIAPQQLLHQRKLDQQDQTALQHHHQLKVVILEDLHQALLQIVEAHQHQDQQELGVEINSYYEI